MKMKSKVNLLLIQHKQPIFILSTLLIIGLTSYVSLKLWCNDNDVDKQDK